MKEGRWKMEVMRSTESLLVVEVEGLEGTESIGRALGASLAPGDIVGLTGEMGAGKTTLVRSVAAGAGVSPEAPVNSPTFTIINMYDAPEMALCHLDLYRLNSADELEGLGLDDLMNGATALLVEWFERFPDTFPTDRLELTITAVGSKGRHFSFVATGETGMELLTELRALLR
jgi:tRNA threonylcarbamoyladenosine biosynthesis protein TsaE